MGKRKRSSMGYSDDEEKAKLRPETALKGDVDASLTQEKKKKKKKRVSTAVHSDSELQPKAEKRASTEHKGIKNGKLPSEESAKGKGKVKVAKKRRKLRNEEGAYTSPTPVDRSHHANDSEGAAEPSSPTSSERKKKKSKAQRDPHAANGSSGSNATAKAIDVTGLGRGDHGVLPVPSVEEILARASKKRKSFLHGHLVSPLPGKKQLEGLNEQSHHDAIAARADLCERIMNLLHDTMVSGSQFVDHERADEVTSVEETLTNDLIRLKKVPLAKQYVEMTLWKRVVEFNREQLKAASRLGFGKGFTPKSVSQSQCLLLHREDDPDAEFVSYREAYMKTIVERFSGDLEMMRQAEDMDADRVQFLLRCLDSGACLFGNLKCFEKKKLEEEKYN